MEVNIIQSDYTLFPLPTDWIESLETFVSETKQAGKRPVIIAIARKMPRLLEFYAKTNKFIASLMNGNKDDSLSPIIITEHALPLYLQDIDCTNSDVVVLDDLIIYGISVDTVAMLVYYFSGIKAKILAIAKREGYFEPMFGSMLHCDTFPSKTITRLATTHAFGIASLKRPIDLEYTILTRKINCSSDTIEQLFFKFVDRLKSVFRDSEYHVYPISIDLGSGTTDVMYSATVSLRSNNTSFINNDFSKIRFYFSENRISISSYAPNILAEDELTDDSPLFRETAFRQLWSIVSQNISETSHKFIFDYSDYAERLKEEGDARCMLTRVVWANYLSSFANLIERKEYIEDVIDDIFGKSASLSLNEDDLKLLIGPKLTLVVTPRLTDILLNSRGTNFNHTNRNLKIEEHSLIPVEFQKIYEETTDSQIDYSSSIDEALSLIFTDLHYQIGLFTANNKKFRPALVEHFKFGESYESLNDKVSYHHSDTCILDKINQWIDRKIDMGVVVPKYERSMDKYGVIYWRRYFRAGENEDGYLKLTRCALKHINAYLKKENVGILSFDVFDKCLFPKISDEAKRYPYILPLNDFVELSKRDSCDDSASRLLWVYLINIPVLEAVDYSRDLYCLATEDIDFESSVCIVKDLLE